MRPFAVSTAATFCIWWQMSVLVIDVSANQLEEQKRRLEEELMKCNKINRLSRLHHLLQDDGLSRWTELSQNLASTFDGKLIQIAETICIYNGDVVLFARNIL